MLHVLAAETVRRDLKLTCGRALLLGRVSHWDTI